MVPTIKGKNGKIKNKTMHEWCLVVLIIAYVKMWIMNWKEIEILCLICNGKISYDLNHEHCNFVGNSRIFV